MKHLTAAIEGSSDVQLCRLDIKEVRFDNSRRVWTSYGTNQQGVIQFSVFSLLQLFSSLKLNGNLFCWFSCSYLPHKPSLPAQPSWILTGYEKPWFLIISMTSWIEIIGTKVLWRAAWGLLLVVKIFKAWSHRADAIWEQFWLSRVSSCMVLHAPLDKLASILPAAQLHIRATFSIYFMCTLPYFFRTVQDRLEEPDNITRCHHFCAVLWIGIALSVTKSLVVKFAIRKQVPFLEEPIIAAFLSLHRSLMQATRLIPIIGNVLERQQRYHTIFSSRWLTKIGQFTENPTIWTHWNEPSHPCSPSAISPRLRSQPTPASPMQTGPAAASTTTPPFDAHPFVQVAFNVNMNMPSTARKLERPLQLGTNCTFVDSVSLFPFLNICIPFREIFKVVLNLCHVLKGLASANRSRIGVDELLQTTLGCGRCI